MSQCPACGGPIPATHPAMVHTRSVTHHRTPCRSTSNKASGAQPPNDGKTPNWQLKFEQASPARSTLRKQPQPATTNQDVLTRKRHWINSMHTGREPTEPQPCKHNAYLAAERISELRSKRQRTDLRQAYQTPSVNSAASGACWRQQRSHYHCVLCTTHRSERKPHHQRGICQEPLCPGCCRQKRATNRKIPNLPTNPIGATSGSQRTRPAELTGLVRLHAQTYQLVRLHAQTISAGETPRPTIISQNGLEAKADIDTRTIAALAGAALINTHSNAARTLHPQPSGAGSEFKAPVCLNKQTQWHKSTCHMTSSNRGGGQQRMPGRPTKNCERS